MCGLLVVDKPIGPSSMDVVRRVRLAAGRAKTGHAGTLDPLASGVVICCLGPATRWVSRLMELEKVYEAAIDLSAFTTTDDLEGPRDEVDVKTPPGREDIARALGGFVGWIDQKPPAFSAVHVNGQRAYRLARRGQTVQMPTRRVKVHRIDLKDYTWPVVSLQITCGKGTYIRSLARDLGVALGTGGHLTNLRRTRVGGHHVCQATDWQRLTQPIHQEDLLYPPGF